MTLAAPANASTAQAARNGPAAALAITELCTEPVLLRSDGAGAAGCADAFASLRPVSADLGDPATAAGSGQAQIPRPGWSGRSRACSRAEGRSRVVRCPVAMEHARFADAGRGPE